MAALVVGVPKEIKDKEGRVSVQPDGVAELAYHGQEVVVHRRGARPDLTIAPVTPTAPAPPWGLP